MPDLRVLSGAEPELGPAPFVPRLEPGDLRLLAGSRLPLVARTVATALLEPDPGPPQLIDCDTLQNELAPARRPGGFERCSFSIRDRAFDPRRDSLDGEQERTYVRLVLEEQARAGATIFTTPHHRGGDPADPVRRLDLRLARIAASRFRAARLDAGGARKLYAVVAVAPRTLRDELARAGLVSFYRALDVDGFVVKPLGRAPIEPVAELAGELRLASFRPVAITGVGSLGLAFAAAGIVSSALEGIGPLRHAGALRRIGPEQAAAIFGAEPCRCGHHLPGEPPADERERKLHNLAVRTADFAEAVTGGEPALRRRLAHAATLARAQGLRPPHSGHGRVLDTGAALLRRRVRTQSRGGA